MLNRYCLVAITLLLSAAAQAVPVCSDVFTDPPTGNHGSNGLVPPSGMTSLGALSCGRWGCWEGHSSSFTPGDYNFTTGSFGNRGFLSTNGATTRLYFDSLDLTNTSLNESGDTEDLFIYVRGSLSIAGQNYINGVVYVAGSVEVSGRATIDGALASGGSLTISGRNASVNVIPNVIDNVDFGGMCSDIALLPPVSSQCPAGQANISGISLSTYDARGWSTQLRSPNNHSEFEAMLNIARTTTNQYQQTVLSNINRYGQSLNSAQGDYYTAVLEGYITAPESGEYTFAIDGDDAVELIIDDQVVGGYYGRHAICGTGCRQVSIGLEAGTHKIEYRMHEANGYESYRLFWRKPSDSGFSIVPSSAYTTCPVPKFEYGRAQITNGSASVTFNNSYAQAPVIMLMPTIDAGSPDSDGPSTIRLNSQSASGFSAVQVNPIGNRTSAIAIPSVDYFVMEKGYRFIEKGKGLFAGETTTALYQGRNLSSFGQGYENVSFAHAFGSQPAMLSLPQTRNNGRFITSVVTNVATTGRSFDIAIEASEQRQSLSRDETLGYIAGLGSGTMTINGESILYEFGRAINQSGNATLLGQCNHVNALINDYPRLPFVIANKNSRNGGDGGWVRRCRKTSFADNISFVIDEDQQGDAERQHTTETIGYFAFEAEEDAPSIDHYRLEFSSNALACRAQPIRVRACQNGDCSTEFAQEVSLQLSKAGSLEPAVTFTGNTNLNLWHTTGGQVLLGLSNLVPSSNYQCYIDGNLVDNAACLLTYDQAGFVFDVPDKLANKPASNIAFNAVSQGTTPTQCVPTFANVTKSVRFWYDYLDPDAGSFTNPRPASMQVSVNGERLISYRPRAIFVDLAFDANGRALLEVNYGDAGRMQLNAEYAGATGTDEAGLVMNGSDTFVSAPVGLCVTPEQVCDAGNATCPIFRKTGENFAVDVQAKAWQSDVDSDFCDNDNTPNYVQTNVDLGIELVAPSGGNQGSLAVTRYNHSALANSLNRVTQAVNEVGVFKLTATPPENYLGSDFDIPKATSNNVGRFIPHAFELTAHSVTPACHHATDSFTYMDQPFSSSVTVKAVNSTGVKTENYRGDFAKARLAFVAENNNAGTALTTRLAGLTDNSHWNGTSFALAWVEGQVSATNELSFSRLTNGSADGPYELLEIGAWLNDGETGTRRTVVASPNMHASSVGDCSVTSQCDALKMTPNLRMRQGRIVAENTFGPEVEVLRMPLTAQYWNGTAWIKSSSDSCSTLSAVAQNLPYPYANASGYHYDPMPTGAQRFARTLGATRFSGGEFTLLWQALLSPANASDALYRGQVTAPIAVPEWLTWYWNWNGSSPTVLDDPRASAYFGTYRGHDRIIYWREVN